MTAGPGAGADEPLGISCALVKAVQNKTVNILGLGRWEEFCCSIFERQRVILTL